MNVRKVYAHFYRHVKIMLRSPGEMFGISIWPFIGLLSLGLFGKFIVNTGAPNSTMNFVIIGVIAWNFFTISMRGLYIPFMYDIWSESLKHFFSSPTELKDMVLGNAVFSFVSGVVGLLFVSIVSLIIFNYNIFSIGYYLIPGMLIILLHGISDGMIIVSLVISRGYGWHAIGWALPGFIMILSGVYYPISMLPETIQKISFILPSSHAIAGIRSSLTSPDLALTEFLIGFVISIFYLTLSLFVFKNSIEKGKKNGLIANY